jgi:hypothetical protein
MFETLMVLLAIATRVLGVLVRILFERNNEIRSVFESRFKAIESLDGPFGRKLADADPAPLKRALSLGIHLDARFWTETLQLTRAEVDEIKTSIRLHDVFSEKGATLEDFDKWFYGDIWVHIQEWRGGYKHVEVKYPFCPRKVPESTERYHGRSSANLWRFDLPSRVGEFHSGTLWLEWDGHRVTLSAGSLFGWAHFLNPEPAPPAMFLTVPLQEGPEAEQYYFTPDRKVQTLPDAHEQLPPWERCYEHLDLQKGLAWQLWIHDCDLFTQSQGSEQEARRRLLAEWRELSADKEWYMRIAKMFEDVEAKERAERAEWIAARDPFRKCKCGTVSNRAQFKDACPHCGQRFA